MIFLGQASNLSAGQAWGRLLACGGRKQSERLRNALADRYGVQPHNVALYHTGRSALTAALQAVAPAGGVDVIIPGLTCIAVVRAVKAAGCRPVFVDITREHLEYDYQQLENVLRDQCRGQSSYTTKISESTNNSQKTLDKKEKVCYNRKIILVQNTLGISWHVEKIEQLAQKYQATIVEDLAHCTGRLYADGREAGTVGAAAALSFGKGKAIDTTSGGAVILRNQQRAAQPQRRPKLADRLRDRWYPWFGWLVRSLWRVYIGRILLAIFVKLHWIQLSADAELSLDTRLTHWQAKLALRQLPDLPVTKLRDFRLVRDRDQVLRQLRQHGYFLDEIWYDTPVSPKRYAEEADFPARTCPHTVQIAAQIINFPTWYSAKQLREAYEIVKEYEI